eukprot:3624493-Amphidinium_carterae.1
MFPHGHVDTTRMLPSGNQFARASCGMARRTMTRPHCDHQQTLFGMLSAAMDFKPQTHKFCTT